jgi:hypothetical protein
MRTACAKENRRSHHRGGYEEIFVTSKSKFSARGTMSRSQKGCIMMLNDFDDLDLREEPPGSDTSGKEMASYPHICPTTTTLPTGAC